jgi:hypothetical protein
MRSKHLVALSALKVDFGKIQEFLKPFFDPFGQLEQFRNAVIRKVVIETFGKLHGLVFRR